MVSKNQKKLIKSLYQKKYRKQHGLFVAEGKKVINELLSAGLRVEAIYTLDQAYFSINQSCMFSVSEEELKSISFLTTPQAALAIFYIPKIDQDQSSGITVVLDDVRDPGNLGTIIRLCDWFGVDNLVCSEQTVDCYNPKVVQATMGSIARVRIAYIDLEEYLGSQKEETPIYGTFMDGNNIHNEKLPKNGVVIMGNEANGISSSVEKFITGRIAVPRFGKIRKTESLNVATATAIILNEFMR